MFRKLRIVLLLLVLATVALTAWRSNTRLTEWRHTIHVAIYPIPADNAPATSAYVRSLDADSFADISRWMQSETERYGNTLLQPLAIRVAPMLTEQPPLPPSPPSAVGNLLWSLRFRWWAWQHDAIAGPKPHVRLFVLFHDPQGRNEVPHSTGLDKGQIGLVHAFATRLQRRQNNVVIAHELLHTYGATDKYDLSTLQPVFPDGYAEPDRAPRLPQQTGEIMAGRIPVSNTEASIPDGLSQVVIGPRTAREIGLSKAISNP